MNVQELAGTVPEGESFGDYVQKVRKHRGLSRAEVAQYAQIHQSTIIRIENGVTRGEKVHKNVFRGLARALKIPEKYLRASAQGTTISCGVSNKVCPACWIPSHSPDQRWGSLDAHYCCMCGVALTDTCNQCDEPIWLHSKFCPECGYSYTRLHKITDE